MSNMQHRLASLEGGLQHVTQELQKFQQVHANDMTTNDRRHAQSLHSSNVQNQQLSGVSVFTEALSKKNCACPGRVGLAPTPDDAGPGKIGEIVSPSACSHGFPA
jgi:hypothetical protein